VCGDKFELSISAIYNVSVSIYFVSECQGTQPLTVIVGKVVAEACCLVVKWIVVIMMLCLPVEGGGGG
jgi:hypothetical protein